MTDRKVMQQALKCIERCNMHGWILADFEDEVESAINALKAALEQPEACQTCVEIHSLLDADESMIIRNARDGYPEGRTPRELTLLERVKSLCTYAADWKRWCIEAQTPLAAQRPWVGLTDEDLAQIDTDEFWQVGNHMAIAMAVEAKLKEKNT